LPAGAGPLLAAGEPLQLPGATAGPATTTASADEPGLLDRLVDSILGGGDDNGSVNESGKPAQQKPQKPKVERTTK
jgi:hypothetical protein